MNAFLYGVALQWKLDIRSKSLLITCYVVPLLFFLLMGGIFTTVMPESRQTLIQSMTVFGVSMGALVGLPPTLVETYAGDIKNVYRANGVPLFLGLVTMFLSAFIHLSMMCGVLYLLARLIYDAAPPANLPVYAASLAAVIAVSLGIGSVLGLLVKSQAKLTMVTQLVFLPSIMLSGILFPADLLPAPLAYAGNLLPASCGYRLMTGASFDPAHFIPLSGMLLASVVLCGILLPKKAA